MAIINRREYSGNRARRYVQPYIIILFIVALLTGVLFISSKAYADNTVNNGSKMYKSVIIYAGDSLESIAKHYFTDDFQSIDKYVREIASINHLLPDSKLTPGNHIIVPYYECDNSYYFIVSTD